MERLNFVIIFGIFLIGFNAKGQSSYESQLAMMDSIYEICTPQIIDFIKEKSDDILNAYSCEAPCNKFEVDFLPDSIKSVLVWSEMGFRYVDNKRIPFLGRIRLNVKTRHRRILLVDFLMSRYADYDLLYYLNSYVIYKIKKAIRGTFCHFVEERTKPTDKLPEMGQFILFGYHLLNKNYVE